jgi:hypothetical protein
MTRREVAEVIFNYIKSIGFKPYNIKYGNGYFIFDKGEDGVVHFNIKGLFGWKFAMWINTNKEELLSDDGKIEYPALQFFTQHKDNIDKFKPSRSCFLAKYDLYDIENPAPYQWYQIKNIIKMIKRHPFISHYYDACEYCEFTGDSFIIRYFKSKLRVLFEFIKQTYKDWIPITWVRFKLLFCGKNKIINTIKIIDKNTHGFIFNPRWDLDILFNEDSTDKLECKYLNKWFSRRNKNIDLRIHRVGIEGYYNYVSE